MNAMYRKQHVWFGVALAATAGVTVGCGPTNMETLVDEPGPLTQTFAVSDHFTPSGFMGDGEYMGKLVMDVDNEHCKERPPGAKGYCYRFTYWEGPKDWAGAFWVHPANNWGTRQGRAIVGRNFKQVRFKVSTNYDPCVMQAENQKAKADYLNTPAGQADPDFVNFLPPNPWSMKLKLLAGGITGINEDCQMGGYPYLDCLPADPVTRIREGYRSVWSAMTRADEWTEVHLSIAPTATDSGESGPRGWPADYDHILGAFAWAVEFPSRPNDPADPVFGPKVFGTNQGSWRGQGKPVEIYIDDIVWDTEAVPADNTTRLDQVTKPYKCPDVFPAAGTGGAGGAGGGTGGTGGGTGGAQTTDSGTPD
jgi:hypothetical protein